MADYFESGARSLNAAIMVVRLNVIIRSGGVNKRGGGSYYIGYSDINNLRLNKIGFL